MAPDPIAGQSEGQSESKVSAIFYEQAGTPAMKAPGRCAPTTLVQDGKIASIDWVTSYPGLT